MRRTFVELRLFAVGACALVAFLVAARPTPAANLIVNGGFETGSPVFGGVPTTFGTWQGDQTAYVTAENAITPPEGSQMLRFLATNAGGPSVITNTSQYFQNVDLSPFAATIAAGNARLSASALFNRVIGDASTDNAFGITIFARSGTPSSFTTLASTSAVIFSDANLSTWESANINNFLLPPTTTFVLFELDAFENVVNDGGIEFDGHYADNVMLTVVPEPSGFALAVSALGACIACARRRRFRGTAT